MSRLESVFRRFGRLTLPLEETGESDLSALDPARDILLALFTAAINSELEPVWADAVAGTPLSDTDPVEQSFPGLPTAEALAEMKTGFPLLAVGRQTGAGQVEPWSLEQDKLTRRWDVDYILCPLSLVSELRVRDVLETVGKILTIVVRQGGHKAYRTTMSGSTVFAANVFRDDGDTTCGFHACRVVDFATGQAAFAKDGPKYFATGLTLETVEISNFLPGDEDGEAVPLVGASASFGLTPSGDPAIRVRTP